MKSLIGKIARMPQWFIKGVFGLNTGIAGQTLALRNSIAHNPIKTLVYFVANIPLWLVWGLFIMQSLVGVALPTYTVGILIEPMLLVITAAVVVSRGYIIYTINNPDQYLDKGMGGYFSRGKSITAYTLRYIKEKIITAGLYLVLILLLPLLLTGSTVVFAVAMATVFIIWKLKRTSSIDVFYKGFVIEGVLVVMWLELITAPGLMHQGLLFLMILVTTGVFSTIRLNRINRIREKVGYEGLLEYYNRLT